MVAAIINRLARLAVHSAVARLAAIVTAASTYATCSLAIDAAAELKSADAVRTRRILRAYAIVAVVTEKTTLTAETMLMRFVTSLFRISRRRLGRCYD